MIIYALYQIQNVKSIKILKKLRTDLNCPEAGGVGRIGVGVVRTTQ
jgi:hypothetical protein